MKTLRWFTSNPDYIAPLVADIEIVFIAFDILFIDEEVMQQAAATSHLAALSD